MQNYEETKRNKMKSYSSVEINQTGKDPVDDIRRSKIDRPFDDIVRNTEATFTDQISQTFSIDH